MAKKKKQQRKRVAPSRPPKTAKKFVRRSYDGAEYSRLWKDWITGSTSANNELYSILPTLRDRCRDLARNDPYANGALRLICDNVLGESGFTFQAKVPLLRGQGFNDGANQQIEALFHHWARRENCDVRGLSDFTQLERLILRTWAESGEVLIREVYRPFGSSKIPYALQVLEPDYLAEDLTIQLKNSTSRVEMGVQIDPMGRREGYWIYKGHPGDRRTTAQVNRYEVEFVPAAEMHHLFICDRPGQLRGVPWLAVAIKRLHFLADTEDAELVAAKLSAFVGGVIKSLEPDSFTDSVQDSEHATEGQPGQFREFEPGMFLKLFPDEDFQSFSNNRPNQALPDFTKHILRGISAGVGLSYSGVSNDFSDASYSSHRAEKLKEIRSTRFLQNEFKSQFHNPITRKVIEWGWLKGKLDLAQYELYEERYQKFNWGSPSFDWIDPSKDIAAAVQAIESGLSTYTIELSKLNRDFEEIVAERSREKDMLEAAGLIEQPAPPDEGNEVQEGLTAIRRQLESFSQNDYQPLIQLLATRSLEPVTVEAIEAEDELAFGMVRSHEVQRKAKNCKKGKPCRNSCISKSKVCLADLSPEQKKLAIQARKAMKAGQVGDAVEIEPPEFDVKSAIAPELHEFYDFVATGGQLTDAESDTLAMLLDIDNLNKYQKSKSKKLQKDALSPVEAAAFEGYIGSSYGGMNEVLYASGNFAGTDKLNDNFLTFEDQMLVNKAAVSGLNKIEKVTLKDINDLDPDYTADKPLLRHETVPSGPTLDGIIGAAQSSAESGEPWVKEQFLSTTFNQKGIGYFEEGANIEYRIKGKLDGDGAGVLVDKYKNSAFESEVLYPPFSQFKVTKVEVSDGQEAVYETQKKKVAATPKGSAMEIAADVIELQELIDKMGSGGLNKTMVAKKLDAKMSTLKSKSYIAEADKDLNLAKKYKDTIFELGKIKNEIKGLKKPKKSDLKTLKTKLAKDALKEGTTEIDIKVLKTPAKDKTVVIEMEEI